jgi:hypothetical protein
VVVASVEMGARVTLPLLIGRATPEDMPYIRGKWSEGYKHSSNALAKLPWASYKRDVRPRLYAALAAPDTEVVVAYLGADIAGWMALSRGKRVDTVHWMATRAQIGDGPPLLRRGVMTALVNATGLRDRIVYTHRGVKRSDEWIGNWLARRGAISIVYEPYERWKA